MIVPEFNHLKKEQLKKRVKILHVLSYVSAAIGIASFVVFFLTHYKYNWSWLLIGLTYILLSFQFVWTTLRMRKEIQKRDAAPKADPE